MNDAVQQRFWSKVDKSGECWEWTASKNKFGYGQFRVGKKIARAHRVAYEVTKGPIADGLDIDHTCRNRGCVNPSHLRAATTKQNCENLAGPIGSNKNSGVRGVYKNRHGNWVASAMHHGQSYRAGTYKTIQQAEAAVIELRNRLFTHNDLDRQQQQAS